MVITLIVIVIHHRYDNDNEFIENMLFILNISLKKTYFFISIVHLFRFVNNSHHLI